MATCTSLSSPLPSPSLSPFAEIPLARRGIKSVYNNIVEDIFHGPTAQSRKGSFIWLGLVFAYWVVAFCIASAVREGFFLISTSHTDAYNSRFLNSQTSRASSGPFASSNSRTDSLRCFILDIPFGETRS